MQLRRFTVLGIAKYMALWEEFEYSDSGTADSGVNYVIVDEDGMADTRVLSKAGAQLSADCQPVLINDEVVWYINSMAGPTIII